MSPGFPQNGNVFLDHTQGHTDHRYLIVHELGHAYSWFINGTNAENGDSTYVPAVCLPSDGHNVNTEEHQSTAAAEGWASFVAEMAFNSLSESDCSFALRMDVDFDHNGAYEFFATDTISCGDDDLLWTNPLIDEADYQGDVCGATENQGNELDWQRFFWDLAATEGVSWADIVDVWNLADPQSWNAISNGTTDDPPFRIQMAAGLVGVTTEVVTQAAVNGTAR